MLSPEKFKAFSQAITHFHPLLQNLYATVDSIKLRLKQASDSITQKVFYNDWMRVHYATNILIVTPVDTNSSSVFSVNDTSHNSTFAE